MGYELLTTLGIGFAALIALDFLGFGKPKKIIGLPEIPGLPIIGNMHRLLSNPSRVYLNWAEKYGDVYQTRMGSRKVVVANSYDSVKELWLEQRKFNNSRPVLFTFHNIVSATQGFTIGTTPWSDSYKRKKKFVATNLNKNSVEQMSALIDIFCEETIIRIGLNKVSKDVNLLKDFQGFHLKLALFITYGYEINYDTEFGNYLLNEITTVENMITRLRSHTSHLQDYIPYLRYLVPAKDTANEYRERRDQYLSLFVDNLKKRVEAGEEVKCLLTQAWEMMEITPDSLSEAELNSACLTMVSAGLDNTPLNVNYCLGCLSHSEFGYGIQNLAINEILKQYGTLENAWYCAPYENMKIDYIHAIIKETLRHMTVLPLSLPRETTGDIKYKNSVIPKGTILFMNAAAANYDPKYFPDPEKYEPRRWLNDDLKLKNNNLTHFSFGLGSRMCSGSHLAYKEFYVLIMRILIKFKIREPSDISSKMLMDPFELNEFPNSIAIEPNPYLIRLIPRSNDF